MTKKKGRGRYGAGCVYQPKGCQFWYVQYRCEGRQIRESSKSTVKAVAQTLLNKRLAECNDGKLPFQTQKKTTYGQLRAGLLAYYREQGNKSLQTLDSGEETIWGLSALDSFFGYKSPEEPGWAYPRIRTAAARRFADQREKEGVGNATINRSLALLRRMLNLRKKAGLISDVPWIPMRKEPAARKGFVTREQFTKLQAALAESLRPLVTFLFYAGARLGEALQIDWKQVNLREGCIEFEEDQTKNKTARFVPLPDVLIPMLAGVESKEGTVFCATNLRKAWHKACVSAGLGKFIEVPGKPYDPRYEGLIIHDLRRSAIRNLMDAGASESVAMSISGHKTNSVFKRYNIIDKSDVLKAMRKVEQAGKALAEPVEPKALPTAKASV